MNTAELNQYLENIAKLIELSAKDPETAAKIVRDSKVKAEMKACGNSQAKCYTASLKRNQE